jgi:SAM-dependent methyltransferase
VPVAEYKRLLTEAYDLDKPEAPTRELDRWLRYARAAHGPVLEVMCGSGRFLVPLALAGIDIDGIDASADMLAACSKKCVAHGISAALHQQLAQDLDLPRRYSLAFIAAGSFGLLVDEADIRAALHKLFEHLGPRGVLVVDAETTDAAPRRSGRWVGRWWNRPDGAKIVSRDLGRYDPATRIEEGLGIYELYVDGRLVETELNDWVRRFWTDDELENELRSAGFVDVAITAADDGMLLAEARHPG